MLTVDSLDARSGLRVHDRIEDVRFEITTERRVSPQPVDPDRFRVPISTAVKLQTGQFTVPKQIVCYVRTRSGETVAETPHNEQTQFEAGQYELELTTLPFKLYAHVSGPFRITPQNGHTQIRLTGSTRVVFGFRSFHEQPAATVTTTADPFDLMQAVSTFGSALKTTSPERSWPTLRGHPPLLEYGDELSIPARLEPPTTDVHIEVPPTVDDVYRIAPLAYYLGAPVEAGPAPQIIADGTALPLTTADGDVEAGIQRTLEQTFFLDCLVRTEGLYELDLRERDALEAELPFELATAYDQSLASRLQLYDTVPYVLLEPELPEWPICSEIKPSPETIEYLPFAATRLSHVRIAEDSQSAIDDVEPAILSTFFRAETRGIARDSSDSALPSWEDLDFFEPREATTTTHAWVGEGYPLGTAKTDIEAIKRRLSRTATDPDAITVQVICNDETMADETAGDLYGLRELVEFDISVAHGLTTDEFRERCHDEIDFLHYIGHVDEDGIVCADGSLDLRTVEQTGIRAFLLNACHSYVQGEALVRAGADGGIVTLSRVFNSQATRMGRLTARLLNHGFPLDAAMSVLEYGPLSSHRYAAIGDYRTEICQPSNFIPDIIEIQETKENIKLVLWEYVTDRRNFGTVRQPIIPTSSQWRLVNGHKTEYILSRQEAAEFLNRASAPVVSSNDLYWSTAGIENIL